MRIDDSWKVEQGRILIPVEERIRPRTEKIGRDYTRTFADREIKYMWEKLDGVASASAEITNLTAEKLKVKILLEFELSNGHAEVTAEITLEPKQEKIPVHTVINTRGFFSNQQAVRARILEVFTVKDGRTR